MSVAVDVLDKLISEQARAITDLANSNSEAFRQARGVDTGGGIWLEALMDAKRHIVRAESKAYEMANT